MIVAVKGCCSYFTVLSYNFAQQSIFEKYLGNISCLHFNGKIKKEENLKQKGRNNRKLKKNCTYMPTGEKKAVTPHGELNKKFSEGINIFLWGGGIWF
jgi:hypothetical protein